MKVGGGKQKGSAFERECCKALSLWISDGARADVFWRSAMSGGRATIALAAGAKHQSQAGDISPIAALGERLLNLVVAECKHCRELGFFSGVTKRTGTLYGFWVELMKQARRFERQPFLIARQNNMPTICLISDVMLPVFGLTADNSIAYLPQWSCYVVLFDCFLREARVPPEGCQVNVRRRIVLNATQ